MSKPRDRTEAFLFAYQAPASPPLHLEKRVAEFLMSNPRTENLDSAAFANVTGSSRKADYLLDGRRFIAELKAINAKPKERLERRLRDRMSQPGAPIVFGQLGVGAVMKHLPDAEQQSKILVDQAGRPIRRFMREANEQIATTKELLAIPEAEGILLIMNDSDEYADAAALAYVILDLLNNQGQQFSHIKHVLLLVESHRIQMPSGSLGFPVIWACAGAFDEKNAGFVILLLDSWAKAQGTQLQQIKHNGDWDSMRAVFFGEEPSLSIG